MWCLPPDENGEFVARMKGVLDLYHEPFDPERPVVCMDESSKQLTKEVRTPIPPSPGQPARNDSEYERNGTANIFMFFEPLAGWRRVEITDQRTKIDWALQIKKLLDNDYPNAKGVRLVMDNLNTHCIGHSMKLFPRPRLDDSPSAWRFTTRRSTAAG